MMKTLWSVLCVCGAAILAACGPADRAAPANEGRAMRIVSLDFCADQYVLKLADKDRILAVSPDAAQPISYMKEAARGVRVVRPIAEDVLTLRPDLVVRSYGGGPNAQAFFDRAGIPVLNVGWAGTVDGIKRVTRDMAEGLGESERGEVIVKEFEARLAAIDQRAQRPSALYMTPTGTTSGEGSLVHEMMLAAGLTNFETRPGWRSLPLERLVYEQPDLIAAAFFDTETDHKNGWSAMRHPVARAQITERPSVSLNGSWMSCGGWFAMDAIEAMAGYDGDKGEVK